MLWLDDARLELGEGRRLWQEERVGIERSWTREVDAREATWIGSRCWEPFPIVSSPLPKICSPNRLLERLPSPGREGRELLGFPIWGSSRVVDLEEWRERTSTRDRDDLIFGRGPAESKE